MFCGNCGLAIMSKFCTRCGTPITTERTEGSKSQTIEVSSQQQSACQTNEKRADLSKIVRLFWVSLAIDGIQTILTLNGNLVLSNDQFAFAALGLSIMYSINAYIIIKIRQQRRWASTAMVICYVFGLILTLSAITSHTLFDVIVEMTSIIISGYGIYLLFKKHLSV